MLTNYAVFTVDHDQQQSFVDFAQADNPESALGGVLDKRDYCCHGEAFTVDQLRELAEQLARHF
jgi:imidazolonepropionase-like amidohydrolase